MKSDEKKAVKKRKEEIIMALPGFINQLLLLMNSGTAVKDAFCRIAGSYTVLPDARKNSFTEAVCSIYDNSCKTGENVIVGFYCYSRLSGVKELTRVANILMENRDKGTDLWEKLAEQSDALWAERKRLALEKIRLAESKMSFPLGILLIALIIITAAPAMLQI